MIKLNYYIQHKGFKCLLNEIRYFNTTFDVLQFMSFALFCLSSVKIIHDSLSTYHDILKNSMTAHILLRICIRAG
jgi:hypothetical protein